MNIFWFSINKCMYLIITALHSDHVIRRRKALKNFEEKGFGQRFNLSLNIIKGRSATEVLS